MAATVLDIMDAIEQALETIPGLRVSEVVPEQINPPQAVVGVPEDLYGTTHDDEDELTFTIYVFTSKTIDRVGQRALAGYVAKSGPNSVRGALIADRTLGGVVSDVRVTRYRSIGLREFGQLGYFGGIWTVEIIGDN